MKNMRILLLFSVFMLSGASSLILALTPYQKHLFEAIDQLDLNWIKKSIPSFSKESLNITDEKGFTPLTSAVDKYTRVDTVAMKVKLIDIIKQLLGTGKIEVNKEDNNEKTALQYAIVGTLSLHDNIVKLLRKNGARLISKATKNRQPVYQNILDELSKYKDSLDERKNELAEFIEKITHWVEEGGQEKTNELEQIEKKIARVKQLINQINQEPVLDEVLAEMGTV